MNKYLEKIAEESKRTLGSDAAEVTAAGAGSAALGGYVGKKEHESMVKNLREGGSIREQRRLHPDTVLRRARSGSKIAPMMDKAFKKKNILGKAKKYGVIGTGIAAAGHALTRLTKTDDYED